MKVHVVLEDDRGVELARADVDALPRVGEHVQGHDGLYLVSAVIWDLVDGPLVSARVIVQQIDG
jgi:hypothetical protein